ncbi:hypothetical protein CRG98_014659 [Punica granatum]|uniref:Uncharacterized protein n=1 Tax=Punica granatum TaxID=22663 RepID=A0A2I0K8S0_PUNGR|nr:hypothetical protein CRG98_014659 [Punica granatum]
MWTLVGARMRAFGSCGLGVSTFPWGRVMDTLERRSRHLSFYDLKVRKDNKQQVVLNCLDGVFSYPLYLRKVPSWAIEWRPSLDVNDQERSNVTCWSDPLWRPQGELQPGRSQWNAEATTSVRVRRGAPDREDSDSSDLSLDYVYDGTMVSVVRCSSLVACEAVLWVGLTIGTKAHLVSVGSEDRMWLSHRDGHHFSLVMWTVVYTECAWLMLPPNVLICRRRALLSGQSCFVGALSLRRCVFDLPEASLVTGLVSPLKRLLAGNALVSPLGLLLARRLLVAPPGAVARSPIGVVVYSLGTGVLRCGTRALGAPTYPLGQGIRVCRGSCNAYDTSDPGITSRS